MAHGVVASSGEVVVPAGRRPTLTHRPWVKVRLVEVIAGARIGNVEGRDPEVGSRLDDRLGCAVEVHLAVVTIMAM